MSWNIIMITYSQDIFFDNYQTFACDLEDTSVILAKIARKETITSNLIEIKFYK